MKLNIVKTPNLTETKNIHMRKITTSLFGVLFLMAACNKQDAKLSIEEQEAKTEQSFTPPADIVRQCASQEILDAQMASDPQRSKALNDLENFTQQRMAQGLAFRTGEKLYIPVVVHVLVPSTVNVTDAHIQSQMDVLTKDYTKTNSELVTGVYLAGYSLGSVANCNVEFYRYQTIRKTTSTTFGTNDAVKKTAQGGSDPVQATTKMNMWVCDLSSGLLGYAQFPGGSSSTDGVVIDYQAFGNSSTAGYPMYTAFNLGRTATHEVGHWLNLRHIWGDARCGNDLVTDTPSHDASNGGCPSNTHRSRCAGKPLEQWMNYMDYTDDQCMYMFSSGQKLRMDAAIDGSRSTWCYTSTSKPAAVN